MSACTTLKGASGRGTRLVDALFLLMVATLPISIIGSWSRDEKVNVSLLVDLICFTKLSMFRKPKARRSCSMLYKHLFRELENGLS